ncbi:hypothetical protein I4641_02330 [Waterburya agarophytonicola K14]|uniref:Uncharacterized protein n=1 Tax=Waterburya agarophytonicola KI4 TaxID=2874699 RepID=A0A964BLX2_9CYAN|nr:hypothetical protein [Waterburya agarophytonicola]MCC0175818.1 hypothetical protein [Waterburya agarophytonicola KI4]
MRNDRPPSKDCDRSLHLNKSIKVFNIMTQATATKLAVEVKNCATCLYFDNFHESNGRGWCKLFDHQAREHHEITNDCIVSSDLAVSVELEDNLDIFPDIDLEELEAFPTEEIIDEADKSHAEYEVGSIVKVIDKDEHYMEWATFEIVECQFNQYTYNENNPEAYLNHVEWHYRLSSYADGNTMPTESFVESKFLWVAENEICAFDMAHNICTEDMRSGIL